MGFRRDHETLVRDLHRDTAALAMPEGRKVGTAGHEDAMLYLAERLRKIGLKPFREPGFSLPYEGPGTRRDAPQRFFNLVGVIPGRRRELPPILLGAHYDSVIEGPCADDNATSVAMNLALAEEFVTRPLERDFIIALFDAEEPPHFQGQTMGSTRFFEDHCQQMDFAAVIVSDLIGHDLDLEDLGIKMPGARFLVPHAKDVVFVMGSESHAALPGIVEESAKEISKLRVFPTLNSYIGNMSDHHAFEQAGQPFLFLSCAQGRYYHDERDDLSWINFDKLARITQFVAGLVERIDQSPDGNPGRGEDPFEFEMRMIRRAVGPALPLLLKAGGISMPTSRQEMDQLIGYLI